MEKKDKKVSINLIIIVLVLAATIFLIAFLRQPTIKITSFEECVAAGNPAMESYPRQCRDSKTGNLFVEVLDAKKYVSRDADECSRSQFLCAEGYEEFRDGTGCGCELIESLETYCNPESRLGDACITLYDPVCGHFDSEKIVCITAPCADTYSNSCFACLDKNVLFYVNGEC